MLAPSTNIFGLIGGLDHFAATDFENRFKRCLMQDSTPRFSDVLVELEPLSSYPRTPHGRKLYLYNVVQRLARRGAGKILLPCYVSPQMLQEVQDECDVPILSMVTALAHFIDGLSSQPRRIGLLTGEALRQNRMFDHALQTAHRRMLYPSPTTQGECITGAIRGPCSIGQRGPMQAPLDLLTVACQDLLRQGAEMIIAASPEIASASQALDEQGVKVVDGTQVYLDFVLRAEPIPVRRSFRIGVVGGIGPAATVDFLDKLVKATDARCDQDHIKILVEQNPQIPDRTANLVADGPDPTLALHAACQRLERNGASIIAIPCNTAHAFIRRLQAHLCIPIINMLAETISSLRQTYPQCHRVGLLATSGTIASRVYADTSNDALLELLVPGEPAQAKVMSAIYGEHGIKAGYREGQCLTDILEAINHLVDRGAEAIILGCTELPLLFSCRAALEIRGRTVPLVDPTLLLAQRCVTLARQWGG